MVQLLVVQDLDLTSVTPNRQLRGGALTHTDRTHRELSHTPKSYPVLGRWPFQHGEPRLTTQSVCVLAPGTQELLWGLGNHSPKSRDPEAKRRVRERRGETSSEEFRGVSWSLVH